MLEVRRVVDARGKDHHLGTRLLARTERAQHVVELRRVVIDRQDGGALEQLGEHALHHLAVLEHVGHTRRHAQVVLEHVHRAVLVADQVGAADVCPGAERWFDALDVGTVVLRSRDDRGRHQAVLDEFLGVVAVVYEEVQRGRALDQARLDALPFLARNGARDDIQGPGAIDRAILLVVDREGDAHGLDGQLRGLLTHRDLATVHFSEVTHERATRGTGTAAGPHELIVKAGRGV